jgi:lipopolysaccharide biosynthesis glycosyltransferase
MIRLFIGFDPRETVAYHVLVQSILARASRPIAITPICLWHLRGIFARARDPLQATDFSFTRFLTPYLCDYEGWSIFMDCDMLMQDDVAELWALRDERFAVQVVKHQHVPKEQIKMLGETQTRYQKKNWSSVMLMNNARCRALTPEYVNSATGLELHQFKWLGDDALIGDIPQRWNHLVGYDPPADHPGMLHYTSGGPYFDAWSDTDYAAEWFAEREQTLHADQARSPVRTNDAARASVA